MSRNAKWSYKRARGPICSFGDRIPKLSRNRVLSKNKTVWNAEPIEDSEAILDQQTITPGCPSEKVSEALQPDELFSSFMPDTVLDKIILHTNAKIAELRSAIGERNREEFTYTDTNLTELRCFIGALIMAG